MQNFEKLSAFYLGEKVKSCDEDPTDELVLYDSKDLMTHATIVGMTSSSKTGLGIGLIEKAAMDDAYDAQRKELKEVMVWAIQKSNISVASGAQS